MGEIAISPTLLTMEMILIQPNELREILREVIKEEIKALKEASPPEPEELLKINEVCQLLRVSRMTVHKWKENSMIPYHRISNRIFLISEISWNFENNSRVSCYQVSGSSG